MFVWKVVKLKQNCWKKVENRIIILSHVLPTAWAPTKAKEEKTISLQKALDWNDNILYTKLIYLFA